MKCSSASGLRNKLGSIALHGELIDCNYSRVCRPSLEELGVFLPVAQCFECQWFY
jgi:hypothetical protein